MVGTRKVILCPNVSTIHAVRLIYVWTLHTKTGVFGNFIFAMVYRWS